MIKKMLCTIALAVSALVVSELSANVLNALLPGDIHIAQRIPALFVLGLLLSPVFFILITKIWDD